MRSSGRDYESFSFLCGYASSGVKLAGRLWMLSGFRFSAKKKPRRLDAVRSPGVGERIRASRRFCYPAPVAERILVMRLQFGNFV